MITNEDKNLLLKDLCARLPYSLYIRVEEFNIPENDGRITEGFIGNYLKDSRCNDYDAEGILNELADGCIDVKPYLRPMSSMTEEEEEEYWNIINLKSPEMPREEIPSIEAIAQCPMIVLDWLLSKGFDVGGLIPMGLAFEAKEGMYKNKGYDKGKA